MIDWSSSMQQTYEYYIVDPKTWKDDTKVSNIKSSSIERDSETLGSASFEMGDLIGECYIRVYLVAIQNGITYRYPLGTFLVETPSTKFDGKTHTISADAYTPLKELKENRRCDVVGEICHALERAPLIELRRDRFQICFQNVLE